LLLAERLEPGFVDRVADPSCPVEEALRSPVDRAAAQERLKAAQAAERARTAAKADENRRRSRQLTSDPKLASLTLADLTKTL
jgi:delta 1-pyrroline-5-carboxylate dehydrogenase